MADGVEQPQDERSQALTYPFARGPETGEAIEVAPGVLWMRMPLGGSLAFINVWPSPRAKVGR